MTDEDKLKNGPVDSKRKQAKGDGSCARVVQYVKDTKRITRVNVGKWFTVVSKKIFLGPKASER